MADAPAASGKPIDAGTYWRNVSDGFFTTSSVGAIAVAPSDSNVIYAGTGETTIRIDVSHGDGVYKSTDAGPTWTNVGLRDTRHIGKIRVHPHDPDIVWVAALGHAFGPNKERGVFKSTDGGATWRQVLFVSDKAGAVDLTVDPTNPRVLYAARLGGVPQLLADQQRRTGQRAVAEPRRRRDLGEHLRPARTAQAGSGARSAWLPPGATPAASGP